MYIPLNCKTHYSVLEAYQKPKDIKACLETLGLDRCGIAETNNLASCVQILDTMPNSIISIDLGDKIVIARNLDGWYEIVRLNNKVAKLETLKNIIVIYKYLEPNPMPNSFIGIDLNSNGLELRGVEGMRHVAIPTFLASNKQDQEDYYIVLCIKENDSLYNLQKKDPEFFRRDWYLRGYEDLVGLGYTKEELHNTNLIGEMCEPIKLPSTLQIPNFPCPQGYTANEYFKHLCREGFLKHGFSGERYIEQARHELRVIEKYKLENYFLVVKDIIDYVNAKYGLSGVRGSAAGCLLSYLIGITKTDPVKFNLVFERFLNEGRFTPDRIQPPDIDIDIPSEAREDTIEYIRSKYGFDRTGQIRTYARIKSPAALKAIFRVKASLPHDQVNILTRSLPADHKISDKMKDSGDTSVIMWCLKHKPDLLNQWVRLNKNEEIEGDFKNEFEQAVRLEGTNSARSKHAAGIIVSAQPLIDTCPLAWDDGLQAQMCDLEMGDLEALGLLKLDLLGVRALSKILDIHALIKERYGI